MRDTPLDDSDRFGITRHEVLSTSSTKIAVAPLALVSAPQATLVVSTLDDVVDATDGLLSLREAVGLANDAPGGDTITFAADLLGGTIALDPLLGSLSVTSDLVVDGDPGDRGADAIRIDGGSDFRLKSSIFEADGVALHLEDLTLENSLDAAVRGDDADVSLSDVAIKGIGAGGAGSGLWLYGGSLEMRDTLISEVIYGAGVDLNRGTVATIVDSRITDVSGDVASGVIGDGTLNLIRSSIDSIGTGFRANGVSITGTASIEDSTIANIGGGQDGSGISIRGDLKLVNSTVADVFLGSFPRTVDAAIYVAEGSTAEIVNSTITGTSEEGTTIPAQTFPSTGLYLASNASATLANSIIDDAVAGPGTLVSNGANTFRDATVDGAVAGDRLGVTADEVFAQTKAVGSGGDLAGVLADNGGPTQTVALLDSPDNPALDSADPDDAPPTDQRGYLRDATPDIGAFELNAEPPPPVQPLPPLAEKVPLPDSEIHGAPLFLVGPSGDAEIAFVDEVAAYQSSLGVYLVGPEGTIGATRWVFERIEHAEASADASASARPGGGPLETGDAVQLSELFDAADLTPGTGFGLFLVADGWARNDAAIFEGGSLEFRSNGGSATVTDNVPELFHVAAGGGETLVLGNILHSIDAGSANPLSNSLNPDGTGQVTSGLLDGAFTVAFEDKPLNGSDRDFNDALFTVEPLITEAEVVAV